MGWAYRGWAGVCREGRGGPIFFRAESSCERRLLVKPYAPEIQTEYCFFFPGENDLNSGKKEVFTNPLPTAMFPILLPLIKATFVSAFELFKDLGAARRSALPGDKILIFAAWPPLVNRERGLLENPLPKEARLSNPLGVKFFWRLF